MERSADSGRRISHLATEYSDEDLIARWEDFFEATPYRLRVVEVSALYPEQKSVVVRYGDLDAFDPDMADFILQRPNLGLWAGREAISKTAGPGVEGADIHLRITDLPRDSRVEIRDLRSKHLGKFISIEGLVRKATEVRPRLTDALFMCMRCGAIIKEAQEGMSFKEPLECYQDQNGCGRAASSTKFKLLTEESRFVDTQKIEVQESPEGLRGGAQPERLVGFLEDDIAGNIAPGDRVILNGVLRSVQKGTVTKSTLFDINLDVVSMEFEEHEYEEVVIETEDEERILREASDPEVLNKIVASISPTIYGYDIEKESIALQLFGGVPKELDDGTRIRGDIHVLLVGDPGVAKCISGSSRVTLADGRRVAIKDLVEYAINEGVVGVTDDGYYADIDLDVISLRKDGKLTKAKANLAWKRTAPPRMLRFKLFSGKEIVVTLTHPFFIWDGGIKPVQACQLEEGEFIATPRMLDIPGEIQNPSGLEYRHSRSRNAVRLDTLSIGNTSFWRFIGLMIGDGYVQIRKNGTGWACFTNSDLELINEVYRCTKAMGMNPRVRKPHRKKSAYEVIACGIELSTLLSNLGLDKPSSERRIPDVVSISTKEEIASVVSGIFDAEGSVRKGVRMVTVSSSSLELLKDLQYLLLRIGIQSRVKRYCNSSRRRYYYRLLVSGAEVEKFDNLVPFRSKEKRKRLNGIISSCQDLNTNVDIVPNLARDLKIVSRASRMYHCDFPVPRPTMTHYLNGDRNPSVYALSKIASGFEERCQEIELIEEKISEGELTWADVLATRGLFHLSQQELAGKLRMSQSGISYLERNCLENTVNREIHGELSNLISGGITRKVKGKIKAIRRLAESDVHWDMIERIEEIEPEEPFVYDLQVPEHHNFIAEDIVVHNSQLLRYMSDLAPRGIYASGKSSSAAGLCVHPDTSIWADGKEVRIGEFVETKMTSPRKVEEGVWSQEVSGRRVDSISMNGLLTQRSMRAVWRLNTPSFLVEIKADNGERIILTPETRLMYRDERWGGEWRKASELQEGDLLLVRTPTAHSHTLCWSRVSAIRNLTEELPRHVYDLTIDGSHAFIANGFVVHNTAAAVKDEFGEGRWTLEAGALVLADKGVACVDELDKMTDQDRSSMHEAMESQTISVAKAGITATLQCRCSILGAANPKYGRFEEHKFIADQINLPPALLSRFDLIFAMTDKPNAALDSSITDHILNAHRRGEIRRYPDLDALKELDAYAIIEDTQHLAPVWDREFLRKYVAYSKRIVPVLTKEAMGIIRDYYLRIRKQGETQGASVPITARQLEAFVRLSEASARARLSSVVTAEDAERAVRIVEYYLSKIAGEGGHLDIDIITTGTSRSQREQISLLRRLISDLSEGTKGVSIEALTHSAEAEGIDEERLRILLRRLSQAGEIFTPTTGYYKLTSEG